jgi:integrase
MTTRTKQVSPAVVIKTQAQAEKAPIGVHPVVARGVTGLKLRKTSDEHGAGAFTLRYWSNGERRTIGLGSLSKMSLAEACKMAREYIGKRDKGIDPKDERDAERAANRAVKPVEEVTTFEQMAEDHLRSFAPKWKHKYASQVWLGPLKEYAYPTIGGLGVNVIEVKHVVTILQAAAKGRPTPDGAFPRPAPETARRIRARIEKVINRAIVMGKRDPLLRNPADAKLIDHVFPLKRKNSAAKHFRRIKDIADAPALFQALCAARDNATGLRATEFDAWVTMVGGVLRPSEALLARWGEVDFDKKVLVKPAATMKSGREHIVPLSPIVLETLKRRDQARVRSRTGDKDKDAAADATAFIFSGLSGSALSYTGFALAPARAGIDCGSAHSWRSIFRDWCAVLAHVDGDIAELGLAHSLGPVKEAYFRDGAIERRRGVMQDYCAWLSGVAEGTVIAFPKRA